MIAMFEVMSVNEVMAAAPDVVVETMHRDCVVVRV